LLALGAMCEDQDIGSLERGVGARVIPICPIDAELERDDHGPGAFQQVSHRRAEGTRSPRQCDATPPDLTSRAHQDVEQCCERAHMAFGIDVVHDVVGCPDEQSPAWHWYYRKGHMA